MAKILFLVLCAVAIYGIWRGMGRGSRQSASSAAPPQSAEQDMVACAHCGVHVPLTESLMSDADGRRYCGEQHRALGPRRR
jgi:uncharacterized protein